MAGELPDDFAVNHHREPKVDESVEFCDVIYYKAKPVEQTKRQTED